MVISMLTIGVVSIILFIIIEWKVAKLPMMPGKLVLMLDTIPCKLTCHSVEIYKNPIVVVMLMQSFVMGSVYQATLYYVPLYLQNPHQLSLIISALVYIPMVALQSAISTIAGFYISKKKRYGEVLWIGFAMWTL